MAGATPRWVSSDQLTILGLAAQIGAGACYALSRYDRRALLLAIGCLALNWLGDSLDGTLARVRRAGAAALRVLCRPRGGHSGRRGADVRAGRVGAAALDRPQSRCWWRSWCCRARATWPPIRWGVSAFAGHLRADGDPHPAGRWVIWRRCATRTPRCSGTKCCSSI